MYYTASPTADAERYNDELDAQAQRTEALEIEAGNEIREAFQAAKPVPFVSGEGKVRYMPFAEAVGEVISDDKVFDHLIVALKTSECPKVKALLKAMAERHVYLWAGDIAEVV